MAKLSSINKNERRRKLAKKFAGKVVRLKAIANDESKPEEERFLARLKLAEVRATQTRPASAMLRDGPSARLLPQIPHVSRVARCNQG